MARLARLAYDFPPPNCKPGVVTEVPREFRGLGFERINVFPQRSGGRVGLLMPVLIRGREKLGRLPPVSEASMQGQ